MPVAPAAQIVGSVIKSPKAKTTLKRQSSKLNLKPFIHSLVSEPGSYAEWQRLCMSIADVSSLHAKTSIVKKYFARIVFMF